jgi:two-component sensor histidine kinase
VLLDIAHDALEPFGVSGGRADRIVIMGENIRFPANAAALVLSIAFNELATNAVKYGAFSNAAGSIRIEWTIETAPAGRRLLLSWKEKDGPPVTPPAHKGFGSQVIERSLADGLEGHHTSRLQTGRPCLHDGCTQRYSRWISCFPVGRVLVDEGAPRSARQSPSETGAPLGARLLPCRSRA